MIINKQLNETAFKELQQQINMCGYIISNIVVNNDIDNLIKDVTQLKFDDIVKYAMILEAKFDCNINLGKYDEIFHISNKKHKDKIIKIGLVPKAANKITYRQDRIYFEVCEGQVFALANRLYSRKDESLFMS